MKFRTAFAVVLLAAAGAESALRRANRQDVVPPAVETERVSPAAVGAVRVERRPPPAPVLEAPAPTVPPTPRLALEVAAPPAPVESAVVPAEPPEEAPRPEDVADLTGGDPLDWGPGVRLVLELAPELEPAAFQRWLERTGSSLVLLGRSIDREGHLQIAQVVLPGPSGLPTIPVPERSLYDDFARRHPRPEHEWIGPLQRGPILDALLTHRHGALSPYLVVGPEATLGLWREAARAAGGMALDDLAGRVLARLGPTTGGEVAFRVQIDELETNR